MSFADDISERTLLTTCDWCGEITCSPCMAVELASRLKKVTKFMKDQGYGPNHNEYVKRQRLIDELEAMPTTDASGALSDKV